MKLSFKEFMSSSLSKEQPQSTSDLRSDQLGVEISGEDSKNKPPVKPDNISRFNPDKIYGKKGKKR
jgi:hypothetical protein